MEATYHHLSEPGSSTGRRGLPLPARLSRRRRRFLTRVPRSRGLGSRAAGDPAGTGLLGRGGGGVAVPPRPRPGSRLRLPPRKAGAAAAAASSFRFPLAPALGRSVLRGNRRPLRAPPRAPQGPTTARLLPREPRRLVSRGPLPPRPRGALPPPGGPPPPPRNVRAAGRGSARAGLPVARLARAERHQRQFCSFPGSRDHPRPPHPRCPRPLPALDPTGKPKQAGPRRREEGSGKSRKGGGRARCRGSSAEGGFPGKVSGGRVRGGGLPAPGPPTRGPAEPPAYPGGSRGPGILGGRKSNQHSTRFYAAGCFLPLEIQKCAGERPRLKSVGFSSLTVEGDSTWGSVLRDPLVRPP
ncbi:translation initiation factor IF-2-like [Rousettus aegyptiacus]|uniref:translation initiation factor IF-2-like n=1 Tax=Rousettus aegyptiacus TaxID=9407 RepID=UPI00168CCFEA|nr:translation initiation factor IF-2-like [Rousettus aegyptiacus]